MSDVDQDFSATTLEQIAREARDLEKRVVSLVAAAERVAAERVAAARDAAQAIVAGAIREADEIRRQARGEAPSPASPGDAAPEAPPQRGEPARAARAEPPFRGISEVDEARALAEELLLGGLGRTRILTELASRFPEMGRERLDAIVSSLLLPTTRDG